MGKMFFCYTQRKKCFQKVICAHCSKSSYFVQKINFDFPRNIVELFWVKIRENATVLDFLALDNFDFTRKNCQKNLGEKLEKMLWFWTFQSLTTLISR